MEYPDPKLLIVGTDDTIIDFFESNLKHLFSKIDKEDNGESGFESFSTHKHDLIITALKLPVMNGLEMTKKMQKLAYSVRVILYANNQNSSDLIQALENGVKGFLFKPFDKAYVIKLVSEQIAKINRLKQMNLAEERSKQTEIEYDRSKNILQVISKASARFFSSEFNQETVNKVLKLIGEVIYASRVYIYQNYHENKEDYTSRLYEWVADGIKPTLGSPSVTSRNISTSEFSRWADLMKKDHGYITGIENDFNPDEREFLKSHNIKSLLAIPIFVNNLWLGILGIDDCNEERIWTEPEITALESMANNFGAAIQKKDMDDQLIKLNLGLEKRVKERTKELEFEIAERSMAEALLKDSEDKYRMIYENATDGILLVQNSKIIMLNPAVVEIFEEIPRNLIGRNFTNLITDEYLDEVSRRFSVDQPENKFDIFELQIVLKNIKRKWLELRHTGIRWYDEPAHLVFITNITRRKLAEAKLKYLNETLEKRIEDEIKQVEHQQQLLIQKSKLESLGELSAGLAHEINQPLVSISMGLDNMLSMLGEDFEDRAYFNKKIQLLFKDIDRIKNIIEHVRIFSRDQQNSRVDKIQVGFVIKDALSITNRQMVEQNIKLVDDDINYDLHVEGNQYKLEQVILNLISNARYAVNEKSKKGSIPGFRKQINIGCVEENDKVLISVKDNGIGIAAEILNDIFDPFFTTKSEEKGTGLGLSISYGIILEMNGDIIANSILDEYTEIKVLLPLLSK